jgi:hypothetical protein
MAKRRRKEENGRGRGKCRAQSGVSEGRVGRTRVAVLSNEKKAYNTGEQKG